MKKRKFRPKKNYEKEKTFNGNTSNNEPAQQRKIHKKPPEQPVEKIIYPKFICSKCGKPIEELNSAIGDKETGNPVHFECVIEFLKKAESLKEKEEIIYIGNGNFAIAFFEVPQNRKNFKITKLIPWEEKGKDYSWKADIANLASKV